MLTPRLVVTMINPETGRPRPTELDVLPEPLTAAEHGLMVGSPPPVGRRVHHGNWLAWPHIRWALTHMDELRASGRISRGDGPATGLATASPAGTGLDLDGLSIDDGDGGRWTLDEMLHGTYTDAFLVLHRGRVVLERYSNAMGPSTRHAMFSMT